MVVSCEILFFVFFFHCRIAGPSRLHNVLRFFAAPPRFCRAAHFCLISSFGPSHHPRAALHFRRLSAFSLPYQRVTRTRRSTRHLDLLLEQVVVATRTWIPSLHTGSHLDPPSTLCWIHHCINSGFSVCNKHFVLGHIFGLALEIKGVSSNLQLRECVKSWLFYYNFSLMDTCGSK